VNGVVVGRQVDRQDCLPFVRRELLDRRDELDAGVVDQDVDRAELRLGASRTIETTSSPLLMSAPE